MTHWERLVIAAAATYLVVFGWAMQNLSYDLWGALVVVPVLIAISVPLIPLGLSGELVELRRIVWFGLIAKFVAAVAAYQIRFDAYGGSADAGRYHGVGKLLAGNVRGGLTSPLSVFPSGRGTAFIEELTGLVYTIFGSSRLGGFMVFTWFSFWGLVFFVKAAAVAVPGLATRRYALLLFLFPSLVYWGSSIGKEAFLGLCLGVGSYGAALLLARRDRTRSGAALAGLGIFGAAFVRPHLAAIWTGALVIALVVRAALDVARKGTRDERRRFGLWTILLTGIAGIGFAIIATVTLDYLDPITDDSAAPAVTDRLASIFEEVGERTGQGGSSFTPVTVDGPQDWPYAAFRTITRPLLFEASSFAELLPALEMTALVVAGLLSWRRVLERPPRLMLTTPYIVFALLCVVTFGVAFSSVGNLGILVRQRSLVLPLVLLFMCLPPIPAGTRGRTTAPGTSQVALVGADR